MQFNTFTCRVLKSLLLLGSSALAIASSANAQQAVPAGQVAQTGPMAVPEQVLVTGSLISGAPAVGVPVTSLGPQDFIETGTLTTAELLSTIPGVQAPPGPVGVESGSDIERGAQINLRGLNTGSAARSLMMVDGVRFPPEGNAAFLVDPSIIPQLALDRLDVLLDGASATYGSDAVTGVINMILKRGYDGAVTELRSTVGEANRQRYQASQLWGRTWDGGDITLSYEWYNEIHSDASAFSKLTLNYTPWGLNNITPLASSTPGTITLGAASSSTGTSCTNCYAIPAGTGANFDATLNAGVGPLAPGSAATLNWNNFAVAANGGPTNPQAGTQNERNPYNDGWYFPDEQRNAATFTVDQRLTPDITFYGEGFYNNRRAQFQNPTVISEVKSDLLAVAVPTSNPYYPTGVGVPANIRVYYDLAAEQPAVTSASELSDRFLGGFHIALPFGWNADIYTSASDEANHNHISGTVNPNAVSAALGWTIGATPASGLAPASATWTKPATVPYLNVFCDPAAFQCNSPATLAYIDGLHNVDENFLYTESGAKFDGPLFDLPAGQVKGAIGFTYETQNYDITSLLTYNTPTLVALPATDIMNRNIWAAFVQLNIPIFEQANAIPLFRKLELEVSGRYDHYSDFGGTKNPKVAINWQPLEWFTFRGDWGTSFRAPAPGDLSYIAATSISPENLPDSSNSTAVSPLCTAASGSGAAKFLNPGAGLIGYSGGCGTNLKPGGVSISGGGTGAQAAAGWRTIYNNPAGGATLQPELANNWSAGFDFAPADTFLKGLDIQATWYEINMHHVLQNVGGNPKTSDFNNPAEGFTFIVPTDLAYKHTAAGDLQCHNNNTPANLSASISSPNAGCPEFEQMLLGALAQPRNMVSPSDVSSILWLQDGGNFNIGSLDLQGIDFNWSYVLDLGSIGALNIGQTGTYYLHSVSATVAGTPPTDDFCTTISNGSTIANCVEDEPRLVYRGRLGWANGPWSVTGFMNFRSHFFSGQSAPPNVNFQCTTSGGTVGGGTFPCAINNYSNIEPSQTTFDLSIGYNTAEEPANDYLKHIGIQLVVQNVLGVRPPFEYRISTGAGEPAAIDVTAAGGGDLGGRYFSLILTKKW